MEFIPGWVSCAMLEQTGWVSSEICKGCTYTFSFIAWRSSVSWLELPDEAAVSIEPRGSSTEPRLGWFLWREKISGSISRFVTISHIALDDDDGGLDRRGGGGSSASMVLSADGVSGYRTEFSSCEIAGGWIWWLCVEGGSWIVMILQGKWLKLGYIIDVVPVCCTRVW